MPPNPELARPGEPGERQPWWQRALAAILPPVCAHCERPGHVLCSACRRDLPRLVQPFCGACGRPTRQPRLRCRACRTEPLPLDAIRAALRFEAPVPDLIHQFKYRGRFALAEPLAAIMAETWPRWAWPFDLALPVPLHRERERDRGYNQAALLLRGLSARLDWPTAPEALRRVRATRPQVVVEGDHRRANVARAFEARAGSVAGRQILLVDDVCTTGSTLAAAAQALLDAGAISVTAYCLARAH